MLERAIIFARRMNTYRNENPPVDAETAERNAPLFPGPLIGRNGVQLCVLAIAIGLLGGIAGWLLIKLIGLVTNWCFYQRFSFAFSPPTDAQLGWCIIFLPVIGGALVGIIDRLAGTKRHLHGAPEAMAAADLQGSRIEPRVAILEPLTAAITIGTGFPLGAEGPIIATGASIGSWIGQLRHLNPNDRKILLAAGAAAGMSATFGAPVASVLMAFELLLFKFQPSALLPVAIAAGIADAVHVLTMGSAPIFSMPSVPAPTVISLIFYAIIGILCGLMAVGLTRSIYLIEDILSAVRGLDRMWRPAAGGLVVGICGLIFVPSMGVGYDNISKILNSHATLHFILLLGAVRIVSWTFALGCGTSGSMAPLFNIGSSLGGLIAAAGLLFLPHADVSLRTAALVGMAALFCGATWTPLTSIVFAFETTLQPNGLIPAFVGCSTSYLVSCLLMSDNIFIEKFARGGGRALFNSPLDFDNHVLVRAACTRDPVCINADETCQQLRIKLSTAEEYVPYEGFPVLDEHNYVVGVLNHRDLLSPHIDPNTKARDLIRHPPVLIYTDNTLRTAHLMMSRHRVECLIVMDRDRPSQIVGVITRSDLVKAHLRGAGPAAMGHARQ